MSLSQMTKPGISFNSRCPVLQLSGSQSGVNKITNNYISTPSTVEDEQNICSSHQGFPPPSLLIIRWHYKQSYYIIPFDAISNNSNLLTSTVLRNRMQTYCIWESLIHSRGSRVEKTLSPKGLTECHSWMNKDWWLWAFPPMSHHARAWRTMRCVSWDAFVVRLVINRTY